MSLTVAAAMYVCYAWLPLVHYVTWSLAVVKCCCHPFMSVLPLISSKNNRKF